MDIVQTLHIELQTLVKGVAAFAGNGYSIFDLDDFGQQLEAQHTTLPAAAVMFEGVTLAVHEGNKEVSPVARGASGTVLLDAQFSIIIALQYGMAGQTGDAKWPAFALLDDTRRKVLGYRGANSRPWRFVGERPEVEASEGDIIFYSQVWRTAVIAQGSSVNS